jgi:hypothetical protein
MTSLVIHPDTTFEFLPGRPPARQLKPLAAQVLREAAA